VTTEERYNRHLTRSGFFPTAQPDCALLNLVEAAATQQLSKIHTFPCLLRWNHIYLVLAHFKWKSDLVRKEDIICSTIEMTGHFKI
jgi:hypothetical protein